MTQGRENETRGTLGVDLADVRRRLRERREQFVHLRRQQREERNQLLDSEPLDSGDRAKREEGVDLLDQLEAGEQRELQAIDAALARIEAGTYGICAQCDQPIPRKRLEAIPEATLCVRCADVPASAEDVAARSEQRSTTL